MPKSLCNARSSFHINILSIFQICIKRFIDFRFTLLIQGPQVAADIDPAAQSHHILKARTATGIKDHGRTMTILTILKKKKKKKNSAVAKDQSKELKPTKDLAKAKVMKSLKDVAKMTGSLKDLAKVTQSPQKLAKVTSPKD